MTRLSSRFDSITGVPPEICLCMIVRNEAAVIGRCLASVRSLISSWVIVDTGSTDGTRELIRAALAGVPGELHERPWVDFGHNRSELVELARGHGDYLLLIDADMTLAGELPADLDAEAYSLRQGDGVLAYRNVRLVRGDLPWRYVGATHEYIECVAHAVEARPLDTAWIEDHGDGGAKADKFERDRRLLEADLARRPDDPRSTFYLAQTLRDLGEREAAIRLYDRRVKLGGWEEEVFFARFQAGVLRADLGDWPAGLTGLIAAWESRPGRLEPLYEIASRLRLRGEYQSAFAFAARGIDRPLPDDVLFLSPWIWRYGMLVEYSISAYWVGEVAMAASACERLLAMNDLPDAYRHSTRQNLELCRVHKTAR